MRRRDEDGGNAAKKRRRDGEKLHDSEAVCHQRQAAASQDELERLTLELSEAHEHQVAASEVLGIISRSPKDPQPVFDAIVQSAARLCGAAFSIVQLFDGQSLRLGATNNYTIEALAHTQRHQAGPDRSHLIGRAIALRTVVHVADVLADPEYSRELALAGGWRAVLAVPMLREGEPVGAIAVAKNEPVAFSERQVRLLGIFADQAVIAIENARRFEELEARTSELSEALQQQTATADVLKAISRSVFDLDAVLQALLESAIRLCGGTRGHVFTWDGALLRFAAAAGAWPGFIEYLRDHPLRPGKGSAAGRAAAERRIVHVRDVLAEPDYEYHDLVREQGYRTVLAVPMLRGEELLGVIAVLKSRVEPFSERQIELVATFADEAVIAIENARLVDELQESTREVREALEYQTAISDVLGVISRSPADTQPVFDAIVQCASRLCDAEFSAVTRFDGGLLHLAAVSNMSPAETAAYHIIFPRPPNRGFVVGRAFLEGAPVQVEDVTADPDYDPSTLAILQRAAVYRSYLGIPIIRDGVPIGAIGLGRRKVRPFTARQIELVQTFASQAVIAIENARLFAQLQARTRDLTEALEQQTATAAILRVISTSPTDVQPVFETIVRNAVALCGSLFADVCRFDGELLHLVASHNTGPSYMELLRAKYPIRPDSSQVAGRVVLTRSVVRLEDTLADPDYDRQFAAAGWRRILGVPLLRQGEPLGVIVVGWAEAGPVPKAQEELLQQFADQAVIAIENARLFEEVNARTAELTEALERQTATSEVLGVISRSTSELQPVLDAIVVTAARLCHAEWAIIRKLETDGAYHLVAAIGSDEEFLRYVSQNPVMVGRGTLVGRNALEGRTLHVPDVLQDPEYTWSEGQAKGGYRTALGVPLLRGGAVIGVIFLARNVVRPFTDKEIELVTTFADQAVIAIENVRLFTQLETRNAELKDALEQQTATGEILRVIASSPTDIVPVLNAVAEAAARLCGAVDAQIFQAGGGVLRLAASFGPIPIHFRERAIGRDWVTGRAVVDRRTIHVPDLAAEAPGEYPVGLEMQRQHGHRTTLATPLLRQGKALGAILIRRMEVDPFTDDQIRLLESFADQAVIAIENVRLFDEVRARTRELTEALEQQTATSAILRVISTSPTDVQPVFEAMVHSAVVLCGSLFANVFRFEDELLHFVASHNVGPGYVEMLRAKYPMRPDASQVSGRVVLTRSVIRLEDALADRDYDQQFSTAMSWRRMLGVPMLRHGEPLGVLVVGWAEAGPVPKAQEELLKQFADQAVIAIENARLLKELRESLQQQTATADVLKAISRATFDLPTVLTTLVEAAARLCEADQGTIAREQGGVFRRVASHGFSERFNELVSTLPVTRERGSATGRALAEGRVVHIADVQADPDYTFVEAKELGGFRTILAVPMLREAVAIGVLALTRREVRPFKEKQIELVTTFADQAAIAIENVRLFEAAEARTRELAQSLEDLRTAQDRLVQTEKLASLGQLTAGIAHEIKNPLNFVNNFAAVSTELVEELREALAEVAFEGKAAEEVAELSQMLRGNLDKIVQHGKRADSIVKNMLLHARQGSGEHRRVDINAIVEESLNLAYHGARAERQGFNITLERSFDPTAGEVDVFPQEITRVLLNLISNGFYAAMKRKAAGDGRDYEPTLKAATRNLGDRVEITIRDNGTGIPPEVKEQLFRPFFTTKPVGEGTGLGLSISHDIVVKQHAGQVEVETRPGEFTEFRIILPRAGASLAGGAPA